MRVLLPVLIVLGVVYIWDVNYNNGIFFDGAKSMLRDIDRSFHR
jgi:hypothetical protein